VTDFGQRPEVTGEVEVDLTEVVAGLATLHIDVSTTILALIDEVEYALAQLHTDVGNTIPLLIDGVESDLTTIIAKVGTTIPLLIDGLESQLAATELDIEALTAQFTHVFVDNITFDDDPTTYTATGFDVSAYRKFLLLIFLGVDNAPTDIVIRVQFSNDNIIYYNYMNGPFGDIRYEDAAGPRMEAISGECLANYMRVYVEATGTDGTDKFILTVKAILTR